MSAPLAWSHRTLDIPEGGLQVTRSATPAECEAVAHALAIVSCDKLAADYRVRALGEGRFRMTGTLDALVTQECVVTLEPVRQTIAEPFDVTFWPSEKVPSGSEDEVEILSAPEIEPIEHGQIEAGRVLFEVLSASIDPYPRKAGAKFEWEEGPGETAPGAAGPFAALKKLKGKS
jgi:uncharacterized metal-binding protein YceD (DUF177 family)